MWAALIYSIAGTAIIHWIGKPLIDLNFTQQRYEADFRFNLIRVRENSEQIALLDGEAAENQRLLDRFGRVVGNWMLIMSRTKKLTFFSAGYTQVSIVFPYAVVSPAYFAGSIQLGGLMQTASAFSSVQGALSFFVSSAVYRQLAEWRAVIARLAGFQRAVEAGRAVAVSPPVVEVVTGAANAGVQIDDVAVESAGWQAAGGRRWARNSARRPRAGHRTVGIGQVDAVPRHRRHLAVRQRTHRGAREDAD